MPKQPRILQVAHGFPPDQQAGAELCCYFTSRELARRGFDVDVFTRMEKDTMPAGVVMEDSVDGLSVTRVNTSLKCAVSLENTYYNAKVERLFVEHLKRGYDLVHFHHVYGLSNGLVKAAKSAGAKTVFTIHDFWFLCFRGQRFTPKGRNCNVVSPWACSLCFAKKRIRWAVNALKNSEFPRNPVKSAGKAMAYVAKNIHTRAVRKRMEDLVGMLNESDLIISPSRFLLDEYRKYGLSTEKSMWLENGMDMSWVESLPGRDDPRKPLRFGFMGSFLHSKGVDILIEAYKGMPKGVAELHLYGTSPWDDGAYQRELAKANRRDDVFFHGPFPHEKLPEILSSIDVLVVPSRWFENAPLTMDEAAMAEIPLIATDHGGMKEIALRRENGLLFGAGDTEALKKAMMRFIDEPELWEKLHVPAKKVLSISDQVDRLQELYAGLF